MLEDQFSRSSGEDRDEIKDRLRKVRAERNRMQRILDGAKEPPAYRKPL